MKILLAIISCARDRALENRQRSMFLRDCPLDYRFFRGDEQFSAHDDVVTLPVPDDYASLAFKVKAAVRWALDQGFDYFFKADTDTYIRPERLLAAVPRWDYLGYFSYAPGPILPPGSHHAYCSGGSGYWLSRRAMEIIAGRMDPKPDRIDPVRGSLHGEDVQVGWTLGDNGVHVVKDERYRLRDPGPLAGNDTITLHDVLIASKDRVNEAHQKWLGSSRDPAVDSKSNRRR